MSKEPSAHVNRPRCLYTGRNLDPNATDDRYLPSPEHIIPLALGGVGMFSIYCVSRAANNEAGNSIDDRLASMLPMLMLRQRYRLTGHRKVVPTVHFEGDFTDLGREAWLDVDADGNLTWGFPSTSNSQGGAIPIEGTEEQVRARLSKILNQLKGKNLSLTSPWGSITDAEDIDLAMLLADRESGHEFKTTLRFALRDYHAALGRFMTKVALCAGHRVLGPAWAFGPPGIRLRSVLFVSDEDARESGLHGTLNASFPSGYREALGIQPHRHVVAVMPSGRRTAAIISLFGGELGHAIIELGTDQRRKFRSARFDVEDIDCVFHIDLDPATGARSFSSRKIGEVLTDLWQNSPLSLSP